MINGLRKYKSSTLTIKACEGIPVVMQRLSREIFNFSSKELRKGHATELLKRVCAEADSANLMLIVLCNSFGKNSIENESLQKFYEKSGFQCIQKEPAIVMARPQKRAINHA